MTETPRQIPEGYLSGRKPADHRERVREIEKWENRAMECARLLKLYLTALEARDKFYNEGEGKVWVASMGVLPNTPPRCLKTDKATKDYLLQPKLTPQQDAKAAQTAQMLQEAVENNVDRLKPLGFTFDYSGRLITNNCKGFAKEFLTDSKFAKSRENLNLPIAESTLKKNAYFDSAGSLIPPAK